MAGGVQNVYALAAVIELQHAAGNGNSALLFDLHPVADGVPGVLLALDAARLLNGPTVQQQLFGEGGFTGVGVADDGKRPPRLDFLPHGCHEGWFTPLF